MANERIYKMIADLSQSERIGIEDFTRILSGEAQTTKTDQEILRGRGRLYEDESSNKVSAKHLQQIAKELGELDAFEMSSAARGETDDVTMDEYIDLMTKSVFEPLT